MILSDWPYIPSHFFLLKILVVKPATMSCHLVGEDFTAEYFLNPTSDNESDSDDSETYIDDSSGSDTDVESVTSDGNGQAPFQWQSMVRIPYPGTTFEAGINEELMPISPSEGVRKVFDQHR